MDKRPELNKKISVKDFKDFYWLKEELIQFCRIEKLSTTGSKVEISERIIKFLQTGLKLAPKKRVRATSKFNWDRETLTTDTIITDNYKNSENVRAFFKNEIGPSFKFSVIFMNWMKANAGLTLGDAINQWHSIRKESKLISKTKNKKKAIAPQFEYNTYLRDFLKDNPDASRKLGIKLWKIKKTLRGSNHYDKGDLGLLDE